MKTARKLGSVLALAGALIAAAPAHAATPLWRDTPAAEIPLVGPRHTTPLKARTVQLDTRALTLALRQPAAARLLSLPTPDGGVLNFRLVETAVMAPALAAKYPEIRTYAGTVANAAGVSGRFQTDPRGFRAQIFTPQGTYYIDPYSRGDTRHYQVYFASDLPGKARPDDQVLPRLAPVKVTAPRSPGLLPGTANKGVSITGNTVTYRLAIAANYEYSDFHDPIAPPDRLMPRIPVVLAELVNVTNRVSGVYERELGIRLQLVDRNDELIFNNRALSPYADADGTSMLAANTPIIDAIIGNDAYDVGHVVSTGGGGVAFLGVICNSLQKGGGVTGLPTPVGDAFYIDFVAHEIGHQFGGNHTFNGSTGSCSGTNRNAATAYEPGSGVTIMAYAGICGVQNIASNSIDTFHAASFDEIVEYTRNAEGNSCGVVTTTTNRPPVVAPMTGGFTIPRATPFELTGSATDPDGDAVTYQWEQFNLGAAGAPAAAATAAGTQPLFRPFLPTASPTRIFPKISEVVSGMPVIGEVLPQTTRAMNFRLTVRDNYRLPDAGNPDTTESFERGGVASEDLAFSVTAGAGPFVVTFPTNAGHSFAGKSTQTLTWDVAGTAVAPVSCPNVSLFLSTDGGFTYPITLLTGTPNDGSQPVTMPNVGTTTARVKVKCANSVFFDISNSNFTIQFVNSAPTAVLSATPLTGTAPLAVTFDGGGSSDPDLDAGDAVTAYNFDYGDGTTTNFQNGAVGGKTYETPGTYTARLVVRDSFGLVSPTASTVTIVVEAANAITPFTFARRDNVALNSFISSNTVTLAGFAGSLPIGVGSGTQYSVNGAPFTAAAGNVTAGMQLALRHVSARTASTETTSTVTVGGYSTTFVSRTATTDRIPDAFSFGTVSNVAPGTVVPSVVVTPVGFDTATSIVAGPGLEYSLNGAAFTRVTGSLPVGGSLRVRHTSNSTRLGYTKTYLTVGGVKAFFTTRTQK